MGRSKSGIVATRTANSFTVRIHSYLVSIDVASRLTVAELSHGMAAAARRLQVDIGLKTDPGNPGGAVVQLYFSQSVAQAVRPRLMLLAFAKVDRATNDMVTLTIPLEDLGYYHPLTGATTVDTGSYALFVGRSAGDICATTSLTVTS